MDIFRKPRYMDMMDGQKYGVDLICYGSPRITPPILEIWHPNGENSSRQNVESIHSARFLDN